MTTLPDPDYRTTRELTAEAAMHGEDRASELAASILSAVVAYLVGGAGAEMTAKILREWAAAIQRREIK
jgi:hypothetical protein